MIAQFNLGCCYRYGDGVALDLLQAAAWFHKAADQGYAMAQHNLGTMYHDGEGVAKNDEQAIAWFSKEAENGNADLQCDL